VKAQSLLILMRNLDRTVKLTLGIWGVILAPLMIWAGVALLVLSCLGINFGLMYPAFLGLQLFLIGMFWELVIYFTFV